MQQCLEEFRESCNRSVLTKKKKTGRMPWTANEVDGSEENEILLTTEQATDPSLLVKE